MRHYLNFIWLIWIFLFVTGCSNSDNNSTGPSQTNPPEPPLLPRMEVPDIAPAHIKTIRQEMATYVEEHTIYFETMDTARASFNGSGWTWLLKGKRLSVSISARRLDNGKVAWQIFLNGTDGNFNYQDWLILEAIVPEENSSGIIRFYKRQIMIKEADLNWTTDQEDNREIILEFSDQKTILLNNADNSGRIEKYENNVLRVEAHWETNGHGWWKKYDWTGTPIDEDSW